MTYLIVNTKPMGHLILQPNVKNYNIQREIFFEKIFVVPKMIYLVSLGNNFKALISNEYLN